MFGYRKKQLSIECRKSTNHYDWWISVR